MSRVVDEATPAIPAMYRLQFEPAQESWVLLYPEGMVKLNAPAAEILRRCDGQRQVREIISELERAFNEQDLRADVCAFLNHAYGHGWIV
jgi:pyrroloquinoline quinone biosynthesis protein D